MAVPRRILLAGAVLSLLVWVAVATASSVKTVKDPRDATADTRLDVKKVLAVNGNGTLYFTVSTYRPWKDSQLSKGNRVCVAIDLPRRRPRSNSTDADYDLCTTVKSGKLGVRLEDKRGKLVGKGKATRRDDRTVTLEFATRLLGTPEYLTWAVVTLWGYNKDYVPNQTRAPGWEEVRMELGRAFCTGTGCEPPEPPPVGY